MWKQVCEVLIVGLFDCVNCVKVVVEKSMEVVSKIFFMVIEIWI